MSTPFARIFTALTLALTVPGLAGCSSMTEEARAGDATESRESGAAMRIEQQVHDLEDRLGDWQREASEAASELARRRPDLTDRIRGLQPVRTRAGHLRFASRSLHDPGVAPLLIDRLAAGDDPPGVRSALAEAIPRTGADVGAPLVGLLRLERDPEVREVLVGALRRAQGDVALLGLHVGLHDETPRVRAEAARVAGLRADGAALAWPLQDALSDDDAATRAAAARSLGVLEVRAAWDALVGGTEDPSAEVRLQSLRAMARIDRDEARQQARQTRLGVDDDARVRRFAAALDQM